MQQGHQNRPLFTGFPIKSPIMREVYGEIEDYAFHGRSCILLGPSGAGKEYLARHYHATFAKARPGRSSVPFEPLNCAGLPETLAISELFGHVKGAFTGALRDKEGIFDRARGGVIFLDEVGDLPQGVQPLLLRALDSEYGEYYRLGGSKPYSTSDIIVVGATDRPKEKLRESLLLRFEKQVFVPGLNERKEDLAPAVRHFVQRALAKRRDVEDVLLSLCGARSLAAAEAEDLVEQIAGRLSPMAGERQWPGNFRALRIAVDTAVIRAKTGNGIDGFLLEAARYFDEYKDVYSAPSTIAGKAKTKAPDIEPWVENQVARALPRISQQERKTICEFLSSSRDRSFTSAEFDNKLPSLGRRSVQNRLKALVKAGILTRSGGRGDIYQLLTEAYSPPVKGKEAGFLALPPPPAKTKTDPGAIKAVKDILDKSRGVYLSSPSGPSRSCRVAELAHELAADRDVYYFSFDESSMAEFFKAIDPELVKRKITQSQVIAENGDEAPDFMAALLAGFVERLFQDGERTVLILDDTDRLAAKDELKALKSSRP